MATILILDDAEILREKLKSLLSAVGHTVLEAEDGSKGLDIVEKSIGSAPIQMVITDVNMPNVDGLEFSKHFRKYPQYQKTPIIVVTTESTLELKTIGKQVGVSAWVLKPYDGEKLLASVDKILSKAAALAA